MVKKITFILILLPNFMFGQSKKLELGLMVGNNGQLESALNDFYPYNYYYYYYNNSNYNNKQASVKYTIMARYLFNDHWSCRLKFGASVRKNFQSIITSPQRYEDYDARQHLTNVSPSICFSKKINKFEIMTGIEIPFIKVGNLVAKSRTKVKPDSVTFAKDIVTNYNTPGGFVFGLNNFISFKYHFTNWLNFGTEINYGFVFANLGGKYTRKSTDAFSPNKSSTYEEDKKYTKNFFSPPEVSFGLFIWIGGTKAKS